MDFARWLQSRLTAHGYSPGVIDGEIGAKTVAAIRAFQRARNLPVTGQADDATVAALREASSRLPGNAEAPPLAPVSQAPERSTWPHQNDAMGFYGPVGQSQTIIELPYPMVLAWDKRRTINRISVHSKVAESACRALQTVADTYSAKDRRDLGLDIFGGSLNVRRMRGGSRYSMHSWGIALDFDPERNGLKTRSPQARLSHADAVPFWQAWEAEGWVSLGRYADRDWMHVQAARFR